MNRRVAAVLVLTLLALVAATVWVPVTLDHWEEVSPGRYRSYAEVSGFGDLRWQPFWNSESGGSDMIGGRWTRWPVQTPTGEVFAVLYWPAYCAQILLVVVVGGLLALVLRTRAARGAA